MWTHRHASGTPACAIGAKFGAIVGPEGGGLLSPPRVGDRGRGRGRPLSADPSRPYAPRLDTVTSTVAANELEAEVICGLLRADGIAGSYRKSNAEAAIG